MPSKKPNSVGPKSPLAVGNSVFIRTITYHYTGKIVSISPEEILLETAAWIASSGRWNAALTSGTLDEVEPFPDGVSIARASVVDISPWKHGLPTTVK